MTLPIFEITAISAGILFLISVYNFFTAPKLKRIKKVKDTSKLVSVLIPARNEEKNISRALLSVINQTYPNIEILVMDDKSEDATSRIVEEIIQSYPNKKIQLLSGTELPNGWMGKCWACHNLSLSADGDYYLFIDADAYLNPHAINSAVQEMNKKELDALTVFPKQVMRTLGEKVVVGTFMDWLLLTLLPLKTVYTTKYASLSAVCGQFLMFKAESYLEVGGHTAVAGQVVEDREFGYVMKENGYTIAAYLHNNQVFCRMYNGFEECVNGFTKNFYKGSKMPTWYFTLWVLVMFNALFVPFLMFFIDIRFGLLIILNLAGRAIQAKTIDQDPVETMLIHPLQMLMYLYMSARSYMYAQRKVKNVMWKGRLVN